MEGTMSLTTTPIDQRSIADVYDAYRALSDTLWQRTISQIQTADPRIPRTGALTLAHNWHVVEIARGTAEDPALSQQIVAILERHNVLSRRLRERSQDQHYRAEHRRHLQERRAGRYLWCPYCDLHNQEQAATKQPRLFSTPRARATRP
jgi:hypothetical protein